MTLPPIPLIDGCFFVDNSLLELLTTCPRALQYNRLNLRIASGEKAALNFGTAIHLALEYRYQVCQNAIPDMIAEEETATILSDYFNDHPAPIDDWRNVNWALSLLKRYNKKYSVEEFQLLRYDTPIKCVHCEGRGYEDAIVLKHDHTEIDEIASQCLWCHGSGKLSTMVELPFAIPLYKFGDIQIIYTGRIDLPVILNGNLFVMDHKTTGMMGKEFFDDQRMSAQQRGYCFAWNKLFPEKPPFGYIINAIRSKEPPIWVLEGKSSNRSRPQTVESWFDESLQRERFYLRPGDLSEWETNTIALIDELFWNYSRSYFPMKTRWCAKFGRCQYYDVCSLPADDRQATLASGFFTDNKWSPLHQPKT